jgi:histidinol dehydrogenase
MMTDLRWWCESGWPPTHRSTPRVSGRSGPPHQGRRAEGPEYDRVPVPLKRLDLRGVPAHGLAGALPRPPAEDVFPSDAVRAILDEVRAGGDEAVRALTRRFDGVDIDTLRVPDTELDDALAGIAPDLRDALELAYERILAYHGHEPEPVGDFENDGVVVRHLVRPVARAGLYAPGGRARYPSTVLMCAAPARVAGVGQLVLCVPPGPDGAIAAETLAAAAIAGIDEVYRVGGAQAVGAMAFGTESIGRVDVIAGPGNRYVAEAKRQVSGIVGVPSAFAGPSEVVVIADDATPVPWAAIDVVVQAEHGPDGLAWLVTWSADAADAIEAEVDRLVLDSPRRADLEATLGTGGFVALVDGPAEALSVANVIAPEHLELLVEGAAALLPLVRRAGAVFLGPYAPASVGDYLAGPNHVLPTARTARFASALRVDDFRTHIHAVSMDADALARLAPHVAAIAAAEGLPAHARSVMVRGES